MANETLLTNVVHPTDAVSALLGPAFVAKTFGMSVVRTEEFQDNTNVIKVPISGSLAAEIVAENGAPSGYVQLADTSVSCTAEKSVATSITSVETLRFGGPNASLNRMIENHAQGHARLFDSKLKALTTSLSQSVQAASTLVKDNLLDARYYVTSGTEGQMSGLLVGMFDYKGVGEIRKELTSISATAFSNMDLLSLVGLKVPGVAPVGEFAGIQIYETSGLPLSSSIYDTAAVFDPMSCFFAGTDVGHGFNVTIDPPKKGNNLGNEVTSWTYFKVVIWRNAAGCKVLSLT